MEIAALHEHLAFCHNLKLKDLPINLVTATRKNWSFGNTGRAALASRIAAFNSGEETMIRCVRIWTGEDGDSCFEEGTIDLTGGERGDVLSRTAPVSSISFRETKAGGTFAWHDAPTRQFVITLSGTLDFQTRKGEHFNLRPGDILLAEDTTGSGHSWQLVDDEPWRRAYVILPPDAKVPFVKAVG